MDNITDLLQRLDVPQSALVGIVIAVLYYFMPGCYDNGDDLKKKIKTAQNQIQKNKVDKEKVLKAVETFNRFTKTKEQLGSKFDRLIKYIPNDFRTSEQMNIISQEAKAAGASLESLADAGMGSRYQFYEEILVNVSLKGSYSQIVLFLANLTNTNKVMVLKNMKLSSNKVDLSKAEDIESIESVSFRGVFIGYRYREESKDK